MERDNTSQTHRAALEPWLRSVGLPEHLWDRLFEKLSASVFDCGSAFALAVEQSAEEGEEEEGRPRHDDWRAALDAPLAVNLRNVASAVSLSTTVDGDAADEEGAGAVSAAALTAAGGELDGPLPRLPTVVSQDILQSPRASSPVTAVRPGYSLMAVRDVSAGEDVWLVDHSFTFGLQDNIRPLLEANADFLSRLEAIARVAPMDDSAEASEGLNEEDNGSPIADPQQREGNSPARTPRTSDALTARQVATQRVCELLWRHVGIYHLRQHSAGRSAGVAGAGESHGGDGGPVAAASSGDTGTSSSADVPARQTHLYAHSDDDDDDGTAGAALLPDAVRSFCRCFVLDEVGSAVRVTMNEELVNARLMSIPYYFAEKGCVFSMLWTTADIEAGSMALRRPTHRWEHISGEVVTDVLYGRDGATYEDSLRHCASLWRYRYMVKRSFRSTVLGIGAAPAAGESPCTAARALSLTNGPIAFYTDSAHVAQSLTNVSVTETLRFRRVAAPSEAQLLWRLGTTASSSAFVVLPPRVECVFVLPGDECFVDKARLLALLHDTVGCRPWCPVVFDGVTELKEFIGDYTIREQAIHWESSSVVPHCLSSPTTLTEPDPLADVTGALQHQDGTNLWELQRVRGVPHRGGENGDGPRALPAMPSAPMTLHITRRTDDDDDDAANTTSTGEDEVETGEFGDVVMVTENVEAVLRASEAYTTVIRRWHPSMELTLRRRLAMIGPDVESGAAARERFRLALRGDIAPRFQFLVLVQYDHRNPGAVNAGDEDNDGSAEDSAAPQRKRMNRLAVHVHHVVRVRWIAYKDGVARELPQTASPDLCLCGPLTSVSAAPDTSSTPTLPSVPAFWTALSQHTVQGVASSVPSVMTPVGKTLASWYTGADTSSLVPRCFDLLRELFTAIGTLYTARCGPALQPPASPSPSGGTAANTPVHPVTYCGTYGVDVLFVPTLSAVSGEEGTTTSAGGLSPPSAQPSMDVQPVFSALARSPDTAAVARAHPGLYADIVSAMMLDCPRNTTKVL